MKEETKKLLELWYKTKLNKKIEENETKKLVPDPKNPEKIVWKGMRGDEAKFKALKEIQDEIKHKLDNRIKSFFYTPFEKKSVVLRSDFSKKELDEVLFKISQKFEIIDGYVIFVYNGSGCLKCSELNGTEININEFNGLFYYSHPNCKCGINLRIITDAGSAVLEILPPLI